MEAINKSNIWKHELFINFVGIDIMGTRRGLPFWFFINPSLFLNNVEKVTF